MSIPAHLARLQHLTGRLTPSSSAPADELARFERTLARHLRDHPDLTISGNRLPHEGADALEDESDAFTRRIRNLEAELTGQPMRAGGGGAARVPARDRVSLDPPRQLGARVGSRDGAGGELRTLPGRQRPPRMVRPVPADAADQRVLRRQRRPPCCGCRSGARSPAGSPIASKPAAPGSRRTSSRGWRRCRATTPASRSRAGRSISRRSPRRPGTASSSRRRPPPRSIWTWIRPSRRTPPRRRASTRRRRPSTCRSASISSFSFMPAASGAGTPRARCSAARSTSEQSGQAPLWLPLISQVLVPVRGRHAHERAGSLRDRHVEVGALHGGRPGADRSRHDGMALARREGRPAGARRRRGCRRPLRDRAEGALDDVAGSRARQDHAPSSRA